MTYEERIAEIDKQVTTLNKERRELKAKIKAERAKAKEHEISCKNCIHVVGHTDGSFGCTAFPVYGNSKYTKDTPFVRKVNGQRDRTACKAFGKRVGRLFVTYHREIELINKFKSE